MSWSFTRGTGYDAPREQVDEREEAAVRVGVEAGLGRCGVDRPVEPQAAARSDLDLGECRSPLREHQLANVPVRELGCRREPGVASSETSAAARASV